jgi:hypothetical protein
MWGQIYNALCCFSKLCFRCIYFLHVIIPYSTIGNENFKGFFPKTKLLVKASGWRATLGVKAFKCKRRVKLSMIVIRTCQLMQHEESFGAYSVEEGFQRFDNVTLIGSTFQIETSTWVRTFTWDMIWPRVEIWDLKFLSSYCGYIVYNFLKILKVRVSCNRHISFLPYHVIGILSLLPFMWQAHCFLEPCFLAHQNACDGQWQQKGGYKNSFISQTVHHTPPTPLFSRRGHQKKKTEILSFP